MKFYSIMICMLNLCVISNLSAQKITINAEDYKQIYEGCGVTHSGYFQGHVWHMSEENREQFIQLLYRDINFKYAQFYCGDSANIEQACRYMKLAKKYKPNLKVSVVSGNFKELAQVKIDGKDTVYVLNVSDSKVYDKIAQIIFNRMQYMHDLGVEMDIYSISNEPDFDKKWSFGDTDNRKGLALLLQNVVPKLRDIVNTPSKNPKGLKMPVVMGPSTLGPGACSDYINYWKTNYPKSWSQLDVVATHQYYHGDYWANMKKINDGLSGKRFFMTEQHTNMGDTLGNLPIEKPHRSILSLTSLVNAALNNGVEAWFYYGGNYPEPYHDGGLIQVPWNGPPKPYKTYYAFKQLNSIQSDKSSILTRSLQGVNSFKAICLRKKDENRITVHVANIEGTTHNTTIEAKGTKGNLYDVKGYDLYVTDNDKNISHDICTTLSKPHKTISVAFKQYSLTTIVLNIDPSNYYEAENNTKQSDTKFSSGSKDFSGTGYIDYGAVNSYLEWNNVNEGAGLKRIVFRYVNGTHPSYYDLYLNGTKSGQITFGASGDWSNWKTVSYNITLKNGNNTIRLQQTTDDNGMNLDRMEIFTNAEIPVDNIHQNVFIPSFDNKKIHLNANGNTLNINGINKGDIVEIFNQSGSRIVCASYGSSTNIEKLVKGLYIVRFKSGISSTFLKR